MFTNSDCLLQTASIEGPWCQDAGICPATVTSYAPSHVPSGRPTLVPEPQGPCTNSEAKFKISKTKYTTCNALEYLKKSKRNEFCKKKAVLESCPGICNIKCTKTE